MPKPLARLGCDMPRQLRVESLGANYHVADRGDRREDIFLDDVDRTEFWPKNWTGWDGGIRFGNMAQKRPSQACYLESFRG